MYLPTHTPCFLPYQQVRRNKRFRIFSEADSKFIIGTNIINNHMNSPWPFWNINLFNSKCYKNAVCVGVGSNDFHEDGKVSFYSKVLFRKILSKDYYHSVRDERTKVILESIGLKAINTGCPTLWGLTEEHCKQIPYYKSEDVIFTLTDYAKDLNCDINLIDLLKKNYKKLYFWPQGVEDWEYISEIGVDNICVLDPQVNSLDFFLNNNDVDYIGTRLHAGIFALQHKKRALILSVDNRAEDMAKTYSINVCGRNEFEKIESFINEEFITRININCKNIDTWKGQFK